MVRIGMEGHGWLWHEIHLWLVGLFWLSTKSSKESNLKHAHCYTLWFGHMQFFEWFGALFLKCPCILTSCRNTEANVSMSTFGILHLVAAHHRAASCTSPGEMAGIWKGPCKRSQLSTSQWHPPPPLIIPPSLSCHRNTRACSIGGFLIPHFSAWIHWKWCFHLMIVKPGSREINGQPVPQAPLTLLWVEICRLWLQMRRISWKTGILASRRWTRCYWTKSRRVMTVPQLLAVGSKTMPPFGRIGCQIPPSAFPNSVYTIPWPSSLWQTAQTRAFWNVVPVHPGRTSVKQSNKNTMNIPRVFCIWKDETQINPSLWSSRFDWPEVFWKVDRWRWGDSHL